MPRRLGKQLLATIAVAGVVVSGCTAPESSGGGEADLYELLITAFVVEEVWDDQAPDEAATLYVLGRGRTVPELADQVAVVEAFDPVAEIRFLDSIDPVTEEIDGEWKVKGDAVLVVIDDAGGEDDRSLYVDTYDGHAQASGYDIKVRSVEDGWVLSSQNIRDPRPLDPDA